jgi:hypothetical protein
MSKQVKEVVEITVLFFLFIVLVSLVDNYPKMVVPVIIFNGSLVLYFICRR